MNWYLHVIKNYVNFEGRARRKEFWMFTLFHFLILIVLSTIDVMVFKTEPEEGGLLRSIYSFAVFLPSLAVGARRLHDIGKSAWWLLLSLIPIIGSIWLLVLFILRGDEGANEYGPDPINPSLGYHDAGDDILDKDGFK